MLCVQIPQWNLTALQKFEELFMSVYKEMYIENWFDLELNANVIHFAFITKRDCSLLPNFTWESLRVFVKDASLYFTKRDHDCRRREIVITSAKHEAKCKSTTASEGTIHKT